MKENGLRVHSSKNLKRALYAYNETFAIRHGGNTEDIDFAVICIAIEAFARCHYLEAIARYITDKLWSKLRIKCMCIIGIEYGSVTFGTNYWFYFALGPYTINIFDYP